MLVIVNKMKKKKILGIFDRRPLIWFHYVLLTGILFGAFFLASYSGIVNMNSELTTGKWILLYFWYFLFISIGDQLIHKVLGVD